jgi:predicted RNase H-like HicB family nuclease
MRHYFALVHKEAESAYGVQFPDVPNVFSAADEQKDIVPFAVQALRFAAEDDALPEPSSHELIMAREDVRAALAEGAYLVSVPLINNDAAIMRANVTFERGLLQAIDEAARARGITRSAFLATAARHEIEA